MSKNAARIKRIRAAVRAYAVATNDEWAHDREAITDMLTDLMHMCAASRGENKVEFSERLNTAYGHFIRERKRLPTVYVVLQEGGSSSEGPYVHAHPTMGEAEDDRKSCAEGAYRTSEVIEVPRIVAFGEPFYEAVEAIIEAGNNMEYPS